jgi:hypothetical protein
MLVRTREFKVTVPALLFDPAIHPFDFAADGEFTKFLVVDEAILEQSPFIDIRFEPLAKAQFWVETAELFALESAHDTRRPRPAFIFHHAFVCSTLLARCLGRIDAFFSLKEPWLVRRLADLKRANGALASSPRWRELVTNYVRLMCRPFVTGRMPLIKATNVANNLLADVLQLMPDCPVLYLYSDLESFLISNLKKPSETRQKIPALMRDIVGDQDFLRKYPEPLDTSRLSFLQACSLLWLASLYNLRGSMERHPQGLVKTLDLKEFLDDPARSLGLVSRHFGHKADADDTQKMTDPAVMLTNAKNPSLPYGTMQRRLELDKIKSSNARELGEVMAWLAPVQSKLEVLQFIEKHRLCGG